jgi:hypothetical protein
VSSGRTVDARGNVTGGRLRPYVEWAGGEEIAAAMAEQNRASMETMF